MAQITVAVVIPWTDPVTDHQTRHPPWARVVLIRDTPHAPWALADPHGRVFVFTWDPRLTESFRAVFNRALQILLEEDGDPHSILVDSGLTLADGQLTDAGLNWVANTNFSHNQPN